MSGSKQRNGLIEIYRLIIGFWVLFCHDFFFFYDSHGIFSWPSLAADFFFVLSGCFLVKAMEKTREESVARGLGKLLLSRVKPLFFSVCFISAFALISMILFVREDFIGTAFFIFRYWWYILYLLVATIPIYLCYRFIRTKRAFIAFLFILAIFTAVLDYFVHVRGFLIFELTFVLRTFGCLSLGMLISYIPKWTPKKFNYSIPITIILLGSLVYLCYNDKTFFTCILILVLFAWLIYFTMNINVGGRVFDVIGLLGLRMYLYISFISTLHVLGLTHHRILFVIDVTVATLDLLFTLYKQKYEVLKIKAAQ